MEGKRLAGLWVIVLAVVLSAVIEYHFKISWIWAIAVFIVGSINWRLGYKSAFAPAPRKRKRDDYPRYGQGGGLP